MSKVRAISLLSGGLDSLLAIKVLEEQGIEVVGITFVSPFFGSKNAERGAAQLDVELVVLDITDEHLAMVKGPRHGYGKYMNPCIDCHALMIKRAGQIMEKEGYALIATGEVLGERPMSQNRQSLNTVARNSGFGDYLLRPLSAKLLPPTKPETEGLVDRERLFAIEGRSRKPQMELAKKYGIKSYVQPAGGCLLTDPHFSVRLTELFKENPDADAEEVSLLKLGRHFRLSSGAKVIVGRDEKDNERIMTHLNADRTLIISDITPGPVALLIGSADQKDTDMAAKLCASYADKGFGSVDMEIIGKLGKSRIKAEQKDRIEFKKIKIGR
ncbi:MAG: tRNA 4-thiouridine(8) synthase ThiI [Pseudomonadota bacterium]